MTDTRNTTVEVSTIWSGTALDVRQLTGSGRRPQAFSVGEDPRCDCPVGPEEIGGRTRLDIVSVKGEDVSVLAPVGARITLSSPELTISGTEKLQQLGLLKPSASAAGAMELVLKRDWVAEVALSQVAFRVQQVEPDRMPRGGAGVNWSTARWTGMSLAVHAVFLALVFAVPPAPTSISTDNMLTGTRFGRYLIAPSEIEPADIPLWQQEQPRDDTSGMEEGAAHSGEVGQMGDPTAPNRDRRHAIKNNGLDRVQLRREDFFGDARRSGILSALDSRALTSPFATGIENGPDPENALGHLFGATTGDAFGYNGLGPSGTGRGGGNGMDGVIGIGTLGTIGRFGTGGRGDHGDRVAQLPDGDRRPSGPSVRPGDATVLVGTLPRDVIRRRIRLHRSEVAHCYQRELNGRPDLAGRVTIRFIIGQEGAVTAASVANSTLESASVGQCVAEVMRRITFPSPGTGVVVVTYPFTFISN